MDELNEAISDMDRSVRALALELSETVHADVKAKWARVKEELLLVVSNLEAGNG